LQHFQTSRSQICGVTSFFSDQHEIVGVSMGKPLLEALLAANQTADGTGEFLVSVFDCHGVRESYQKLGRLFRRAVGALAGLALAGFLSSRPLARGADRLKVAPHDMSRTFSHIARKADASTEQIQLTLSNASISTTQRYLGTRQDLSDTPSDRVRLRIR
jgi:hypothetical protein